MMFRVALVCAGLLCLAACAPSVPPSSPEEARFMAFFHRLEVEAEQKGYNARLLRRAYDGPPAPLVHVTQAEGNQPESKRTFTQYVQGLVTPQRMTTGADHLQGHGVALAQIAAKTGVSSSVVVALWGIETNFGVRQGEVPTIPALVTLAYASPRADYFRKEVFNALQVVETTGFSPRELVGSWAGAMGQCQFMPSSYLRYASDGDGDGKADIWHSVDDVFASAARYLGAEGWKQGQPWKADLSQTPGLKGVEVNSRGLSAPLTLAEWRKRGAVLAQPEIADGWTPATQLRYYRPEGKGPAYLLGPNFSVILKWNNSSYFAWAVLSLADAVEQSSYVPSYVTETDS